ncbi:MAG: radical SAM protein [Candidatus Heimdallarchaeota archaeon]
MPFPTLLSWNTTFGCNLSCPHCYADARKQKSAQELSTDQGISLIQELGQLKRLILVFSGGEPLSRRDILSLISTASEEGIRPVLGTNGILLQKYIDRLVDSGLLKVGISIDSSNPSEHDQFRGFPGAFSRIMDGIRATREAGMPIQIHTTIHQGNIDEIPNMITLAEKVGADAVHYFFLVPTGRGQTRMGKQELTKDQYYEALDQLYSLQLESSILLKPVCAPQYLRVFKENASSESKLSTLQRFGHFTRFAKGCLAGDTYGRIDPHGNVTPCPYLPLIVGNVTNQSFSDIWTNSPVLQELRDLNGKNSGCNECKHVNLCGGGCKARLYAISGSQSGFDPYCQN